jgi:CheY-like chemotaxis protein
MQPTVENPVPTTRTSVATTLSAETKRTRVLLIDDNEQFLNTIMQLLEPLGYDLVAVNNPVKALEMYTREKDNFDLVLLDYYMPALDGAKTFEWLRKLNPRVRVIICSGAEELRLRQVMTQHPIDAYIHKPFRIEEAMHVIRQVMAKPLRRV